MTQRELFFILLCNNVPYVRAGIDAEIMHKPPHIENPTDNGSFLPTLFIKTRTNISPGKLIKVERHRVHHHPKVHKVGSKSTHTYNQ